VQGNVRNNNIRARFVVSVLRKFCKGGRDCFEASETVRGQCVWSFLGSSSQPTTFQIIINFCKKVLSAGPTRPVPEYVTSCHVSGVS
jgi:hypothetical protein